LCSVGSVKDIISIKPNPIRLGTESHGDTAIDIGKYTLSGEAGNVMDSGKYVVILKQEGGQWKLHRDIWNSSLTPQGD